MRDDTQKLFGSYKGFITRITATFGEVDEEKQAERAIQILRRRILRNSRGSTKTGVERRRPGN
jgi:hypothetical protein